MEELIFFAVIILFSILESIARSRKAKRGGGVETDGVSLPDARDWEARVPDLDDELPTYDEDPTYDEIATRKRKKREDKTVERYTRPSGTERAGTVGAKPAPAPPRRPSTETMLPGDLLEQLEGLARGRRAERARTPRRKPQPLDLPDQSPPLPPLERTEVGTGRPASPPKGPIGSTAPIGSRTPVAATEHMVHRSHAGYGTDPSTRVRSEQDAIDPLGERLSPDALAVRRQLLGGGRPALRQAIVLKEVLGAPIALRGDHLGP